MNTPAEYDRRPRHTWPQRIGRAAVIGVLVVASAWVTLPWWLPTGLIRQRLEENLSAQLGASVRIGALRTRWSGVTMYQLRIGPGAPGRDLLTVSQLICSFSPLDLLLARRIDWMEAYQPTITLRRDGGRWNFEQLNPPEPLDIGSLSIRRGRVLIVDGPDELALRISDMQVRQKPGSKLGQITMSAWLDQPGRPAALSLRIASRHGTEVGEAALGFWGVDLSALPLAGPDRALRTITGRARGTLRLAVNPNLEVTRLGLEVLAENLAITPASGRELPTLDRAGLTIATQIDPAGRVMDVTSLELRLPGIDLAGRAKIFPDILSAGLDSIASLQIRGHVDPRSVRDLLEANQPGPQPRFDLAGPVELTLGVDRTGQGSNVRLRLDATALELSRGETIFKPADHPLGLELQWRRASRGEPCLIEQARLETDGLVLTAMGRLAPAGLSGSPSASPVDEALVLTRRLELRGRIFTGPSHARCLRGRWMLEPSAQPRLTISTLWPVGQDETLSADAAVTIDPATCHLRDATAELIYNQAELHWAAQAIALPKNLDSPEQFESTWRLDRIEALAPQLGPLARHVRMRGSLSGRLTATLSDHPCANLTIDGRPLDLQVEPWLAKPAGVDLQAQMSLTAEPTAQPSVNLDGWLELAPLGLKLDATMEPDRTFRGQIELLCRNLQALPALSPALAKRLGTGQLRGSAKLGITSLVNAQTIETTTLLRCGPVQWTPAKPADGPWLITPAVIELHSTLRNRDQSPRLDSELTFVQGKVIGPDKTTHTLTGRARLQAELPDKTGLRWPDATLDLDALTGQLGGKEILLDGGIRLAGLMLGRVDRPELNSRGEPTGRIAQRPTLQRLDRLDLSALQYRLGSNSGFVEGQLESLHRGPRGRLTLLAERLDPREISQWLAPDTPTTRLSFSEARRRTIRHEARDLIQRGRRYLAQADLTANLTARQFVIYDAKVNTELTSNQLALSLRAQDDAIELRYSGGYAGGALRGRLITHLDAPLPRLTQQTTIDEIKATPRVQPMISRDFPGNTVNGLFSRSEVLEIPLDAYLGQAIDPRYPMHPEGTAKLVATDGVVVGPGAPAFVTRIFPGLNLTEYRYDRMTAFNTYLPDGTAENETIFSGRYDVYTMGTTAADGQADYTLGLVLLGGGRAEWQHDWKQGRIPLLTYRGRIVNGEFLDRVVSYPWPNQTLGEIFIRNNLIYRAWVNMEKDRPASNPAGQ
jgi:hypothetical protein